MPDPKFPIPNPKSPIRNPQSPLPSPLERAGRAANIAAGRYVFQRYMSEKSANTLKRQARDLELFAEYLIDLDIPLSHGADFQNDPGCWRGISWGIVEGFVGWMLREGYAISSVNARLTTVRVYAGMAAKAGAIDPREALLIQSVKGFSRQGGLNVDEQREQKRIEDVTYAYKPEGARRRVVVTRRSTKKRKPTLLSDEEAVTLKTFRNESPQGLRDALLMRLLLNHGLRASEVALLTADNFNLDDGELTFYRPKVKGTDHEWTTHKLTAGALEAANRYIGKYVHYIKEESPAFLGANTPAKAGAIVAVNSPVMLATTRLLKDGSGGQLIPDRPLSRVRISERVTYLGKKAGLAKKLSAHDCRHYCATKMARLGYGVDELMAWFGWTSAQTAVRYVAQVDVKERYKG